MSRIAEALLDWKRRALPFEAVLGDEREFPAALAAARAWLRARGVAPAPPETFPAPRAADEDGILVEIAGAGGGAAGRAPKRASSPPDPARGGTVALAVDLAARTEAWIDHADPAARGAGEALAARLMRRFEITRRFPAAYAPGWKSAGDAESWTALARCGVVWLKLWRRDGDVRWLNAALNAAQFLVARRAGSGALPAGHRQPGSGPDPGATAQFARLLEGALDGLRRVDEETAS